MAKKGSDQAREFFRSLKRSDKPKPIYIVFGEETFLLDLAMKELVQLVLPGGINDFNYDVFYAREVDVHKVISACETLALFGGQRLVILKDIQWMSASDLKPLTTYLDNPSPSTTLVCHGVQEFKALREWEVGRFLRGQASKRQLNLTHEAEEALIGSVGTDLATLDMALEKLDLYLGAGEGVREVTEDMLQEVVAATRSHEIFELTEAIASQNLARSMSLLDAMLEQGQRGVGINLMVARQMRQIWQVQVAMSKGMGKSDIARAAGMNPYFVDRYRGYARRFKASKLRSALAHTLKTDRLLKSSRLSDRVLLEQLVIAVCTG